MQQQRQDKEKEENEEQYQQLQEESPIYNDPKQVGNKKDIANKTKATVPPPVGMYSHLYAVHPTSDEYSSLQHNTTRVQGQGPPAVPCDENYETGSQWC